MISNDSDSEPSEAVVVVSVSCKHWSRVGAVSVHNLHNVPCEYKNNKEYQEIEQILLQFDRRNCI